MPGTVCCREGKDISDPEANNADVLSERKRHARFVVSVAGGENLRRVVEGEQVVDLVKVSVQIAVGPIDADHDVLDRNVGRNANTVLNIQFLELYVSAIVGRCLSDALTPSETDVAFWSLLPPSSVVTVKLVLEFMSGRNSSRKVYK